MSDPHDIGAVLTDMNGGPAFPFPMLPEPQRWDGDCQEGMSLRDYFAAKAMQGMLARPGAISLRLDAEFAYQMADAMLKARAA